MVAIALAVTGCATLRRPTVWIPAAAMAVPAALDAHATIAYCSRAPCEDANPFNAAFVRSPVLYVVNAVEISFWVAFGESMRNATGRDSAFFRKVWWVPAAANTLLSFLAWQHSHGR